MGSSRKVLALFVSAIIALLFSVSSNIYSIETIRTNYSKELKASHQEALIHNSFEKYYLPQSSGETVPLPEFTKNIHQELDSLSAILKSSHYFFYQKIIYHRLSSSEIIFPTHFFW